MLSFSADKPADKNAACERIAELKREQDRLRALPDNGGFVLNASNAITAIDGVISRLRQGPYGCRA